MVIIKKNWQQILANMWRKQLFQSLLVGMYVYVVSWEILMVDSQMLNYYHVPQLSHS